MNGIEEAMVKLANDKQRRIDAVNDHIVRLSREVVERRGAKCALQTSASRARPSLVRQSLVRRKRKSLQARTPDYLAALNKARPLARKPR